MILRAQQSDVSRMAGEPNFNAKKGHQYPQKRPSSWFSFSRQIVDFSGPIRPDTIPGETSLAAKQVHLRILSQKERLKNIQSQSVVRKHPRALDLQTCARSSLPKLAYGMWNGEG